MRQVWTIGHWTCPEEVFLAPLLEHRIDLVADVRAHPGSRSSPQFGGEALREWLDSRQIGYRHLPDLGGRRPAQAGVDPVLNAGWHNRSFKNYADYTTTDGYERGLAQLVACADEHRVALLCGEPMPWRCHRLLIANTLVVRGWTVEHVFTDRPGVRHELGRWGARPVADEDGSVSYPPETAAGPSDPGADAD